MAVGFLVLAGCADSGVDEPEMAGADVEPVELGDELGCESVAETETNQGFVREAFDCPVDGEPHLLLTFNSTNARNLWLETADTLGYVVVEQGPTWVLFEDET